MTRPLLLDLFCGAGGAARGYHDAGFDVVGVDIHPQLNYPYTSVVGDALELAPKLLAAHPFVAVHASPPCHDHARTFLPAKHGTGWLLAATRSFLAGQPLPWVIENVPGAPMRADYKLCGCMFGLPRLRRERWFETSWAAVQLRQSCHHAEPIVTVTGDSIPSHSPFYGRVSGHEYNRLAREAMGIDWMTRRELSQAIPPAYTRFIGEQLLAAIREDVAA